MDGYDEGYEESEVLSYRLNNVKTQFISGEIETIPLTYREATSDKYMVNPTLIRTHQRHRKIP